MALIQKKSRDRSCQHKRDMLWRRRVSVDGSSAVGCSGSTGQLVLVASKPALARESFYYYGARAPGNYSSAPGLALTFLFSGNRTGVVWLRTVTCNNILGISPRPKAIWPWRNYVFIGTIGLRCISINTTASAIYFSWRHEPPAVIRGGGALDGGSNGPGAMR